MAPKSSSAYLNGRIRQVRKLDRKPSMGTYPASAHPCPSGRPSARSPDKRYAVTDELATQSIYRLTATYG